MDASEHKQAERAFNEVILTDGCLFLNANLCCGQAKLDCFSLIIYELN